MRLSAQVPAVLALVALAACDQKGIAPAPKPARLVVVSGDAQSAEVGATLSDSVALRVENDRGDAAAGAVVLFQTLSGGSMAGATVRSGPDGRASTSWTLGDTAGVQRAQAQLMAGDGAVVHTATLTATARAGAPASLARVAGDAQTGQVASALAQPLIVRVLDSRRNPVTGAIVTWNVAAGGGSVFPANSSTDVTGAAGTTWTLGKTAGTQSVSARLGSLSEALVFAATASAGPPALVAVAPKSATIALGQTVQLSARLQDAHGNGLSASAVSWRTLDPGVAPVSAAGEVTGLGAGAGRVVASAGSVADTAVVTVKAAPVVATVKVTPGSSSLEVGATVQLSATALDQYGEVMGGQSLTWSSSNPSVASVDASGLVTGKGSGSAMITASAAGKSGTSALDVSAPPAVLSSVDVAPAVASIAQGGTVQLAATARDQQGHVIAGRSFSWTTSNAAVATVSSAGLVAGVSAGTARVTATTSGASGSAGITVTARVPASLVKVGGDGQTGDAGYQLPEPLLVRVLDAAGKPLQGATVHFDAGAGGFLWPPDVISDSLGLASSTWTLGHTPGSHTATATVPGGALKTVFGATATAAPVATVTISFGPAFSLEITSSIQFLATARDARRGVVLGRTFTWSSSDTSIARVDQTGLVRAGAPGITTITATTEGVSGSIQVRVFRRLHLTAVSDSGRTLRVGRTYPNVLTLTAQDLAGVPFPGVTIHFSGEGAIRPLADSAVTDAAGQVRLGVRTDTVAGFGSINASSELFGFTVAPGPAVRIDVQPKSVTLNGLGACQRMDGHAYDRYNNLAADASTLRFSTTNANAHVKWVYYVCAKAVGSSGFIAAWDAIADTVPVTIRQVPATLNPADIRAHVGSSWPLVAKDSSGVDIPSASLRWSSSATATIRVDGTGAITGVSPGTATISAANDFGGTSKDIVAAGPVTISADSAVRVRPDSASVAFTVSLAGFRLSQVALHYTTDPGFISGVRTSEWLYQWGSPDRFQSWFILSGLAPATKYYWRITANVGYAGTVTSNTGSFTTR